MDCKSFGTVLNLQGWIKKERTSGCCSVGFLSIFSFSHVGRYNAFLRAGKIKRRWVVLSVFPGLMSGGLRSGSTWGNTAPSTGNCRERSGNSPADNYRNCRSVHTLPEVRAGFRGMGPVLVRAPCWIQSSPITVLKPLMISEHGAPHFILPWALHVT